MPTRIGTKGTTDLFSATSTGKIKNTAHTATGPLGKKTNRPRSGTMFNARTIDWANWTSRWFHSQRRAHRLTDTTQWLNANGLLSNSDKQNLNSFTDKQKKELKQLLQVPKRYSSGVKSADDRRKIRAQVLLVAARTGDLNKARAYRQCLTESYVHTKQRLYQSISAESLRDPSQFVPKLQNLRANHNLLLTASNLGTLARLAHTGLGSHNRSLLTSSNDVFPAVKYLTGKGLLDAESAERLRQRLQKMPGTIDDLMHIDRSVVRNAHDRQKIREAVLMRVATRGTNSAKEFKDYLMAPVKPLNVATPQLSKTQSRSEYEKEKHELNPDPNIAAKDIKPDGSDDKNAERKKLFDEFDALLESDDISVLDINDLKNKGSHDAENRMKSAPGIELNCRNYELLQPLKNVDDPGTAAREQWNAIGDDDFDMTAKPATQRLGPNDLDRVIDACISDRIKQARRTHGDKAKEIERRQNQIKQVLKFVNDELPDSLSLRERAEALADATHIFTTFDSKGALTNLDNINDAILKMYVDLSGDPRSLIKGAVVNALYGRDNDFKQPFTMSRGIRELTEDVAKIQRDRREARAAKSLELVFDATLGKSDRAEAIRHLMDDDLAYRQNDVLIPNLLSQLHQRDPSGFERTMKPLRELLTQAEKSGFMRVPDQSRNAQTYDLSLKKPTKAQGSAMLLQSLSKHYMDAWSEDPDLKGVKDASKLTVKQHKALLQEAVRRTAQKHKDLASMTVSDIHDQKRLHTAQLGKDTGTGFRRMLEEPTIADPQKYRDTAFKISDSNGVYSFSGPVAAKPKKLKDEDLLGLNSPVSPTIDAVYKYKENKPHNEIGVPKLLEAEVYFAKDRKLFLEHARPENAVLWAKDSLEAGEPFYLEPQQGVQCGMHAINAFVGGPAIGDTKQLTAFVAASRMLDNDDHSVDKKTVDTSLGNDTDMVRDYINWSSSKDGYGHLPAVESVLIGSDNDLKKLNRNADRLIVKTEGEHSSHFVTLRRDKQGGWRLIDSLNDRKNGLDKRQPLIKSPADFIREKQKGQWKNAPIAVIQPTQGDQAANRMKALAMIHDQADGMKGRDVKFLQDLVAKEAPDKPMEDQEILKFVGQKKIQTQNKGPAQRAQWRFDNGFFNAAQARTNLADYILEENDQKLGLKLTANERSDILDGDFVKRMVNDLELSPSNFNAEKETKLIYNYLQATLKKTN